MEALSFKNYKQLKQITDVKANYKILKRLGEGSFGTVYLVESKKFNQSLAIKQIKKKQVAKHSVYQGLLLNELFVVQKIDHPHIGRVFAIEEDSKNYFIVMEYLSGGNLLEVLEK